MVSQTGISIFNCYAHNSKIRRVGKKLVADLDSAPQITPKSFFTYQLQKFCFMMLSIFKSYIILITIKAAEKFRKNLDILFAFNGLSKGNSY